MCFFCGVFNVFYIWRLCPLHTEIILLLFWFWCFLFSVLPMFFSAPTEMNIQFLTLMWCHIYWFAYVESSLNRGILPAWSSRMIHLMGVWSSSGAVGFALLEFCWGHRHLRSSGTWACDFLCLDCSLLAWVSGQRWLCENSFRRDSPFSRFWKRGRGAGAHSAEAFGEMRPWSHLAEAGFGLGGSSLWLGWAAPGCAWFYSWPRRNVGSTAMKARCALMGGDVTVSTRWNPTHWFPSSEKMWRSVIYSRKMLPVTAHSLGKESLCRVILHPRHLGECLTNCIFIEPLINEQAF